MEKMAHFADRLAAGIRSKKTALCVGLDPRWDGLPSDIRNRHADGSLRGVARAFEEFSLRIIDVVAPLVAVVKAQAAFFEACGPAGLEGLQRVLGHAHRRGLMTILDGKRNDIAATAAAYAEASFAGVNVDGRLLPVWDADAITVNPYLGRDAVEPFLKCARQSERGVFVLVRTSNPGAGQFQDLQCEGKPLFMHVAEAVAGWSKEHLGKCGYGDVGAVVGATYPQELAALRRQAPDVVFLVPGFGAQGGSAADIMPAFDDRGLGAVVNSSRGISMAFPPNEPAWEGRVEAATRTAIESLPIVAG
jgi:orotidine-5'-phosphate decarboxylase